MTAHHQLQLIVFVLDMPFGLVVQRAGQRTVVIAERALTWGLLAEAAACLLDPTEQAYLVAFLDSADRPAEEPVQWGEPRTRQGVTLCTDSIALDESEAANG